MANGEIGVRIIEEREPENNKLQYLGQIGNPVDVDNAAGVEVRGRTSLDSSGVVDVDRFYGVASFWREGFDHDFDRTPVDADMGIGVNIDADQFAIVGVTVYNHFREVLFTGIDWVIGSTARSSLGELADTLEDFDTDFVASPYQVPTQEIGWQYPVVIGVPGNMFYVEVVGTAIDPVAGVYEDIGYTLNWAFG